MNGVRPKVRHGHVMIAVKNGIYLHGGMAGTENFGDLWKLTIGMCNLSFTNCSNIFLPKISPNDDDLVMVMVFMVLVNGCMVVMPKVIF